MIDFITKILQMAVTSILETIFLFSGKWEDDVGVELWLNKIDAIGERVKKG